MHYRQLIPVAYPIDRDKQRRVELPSCGGAPVDEERLLLDEDCDLEVRLAGALQ